VFDGDWREIIGGEGKVHPLLEGAFMGLIPKRGIGADGGLKNLCSAAGGVLRILIEEALSLVGASSTKSISCGNTTSSQDSLWPSLHRRSAD